MTKYNLLDKINSPDDLKKLDIKFLNKLAKQMRSFLITNVADTGGHLGSNLGVVELTIALHYVFNSPIDKIIWDVGHQSYIHKILTGRKNKFKSLRKFRGLSGFPKSHESEHDCFNAGHSSTSISAALGFCIARDLNQDDYKIIAIIGDGSMTGGLSYEALNNSSKKNIIIILNDNHMSICENVGGIAKYLNELRTQPIYINTKQDINNFLNKIPVVGKNIKRLIEKAKGSIKYLIYSNTIFEQLGFNYIGPLDGHNIKKLIEVFKSAQKLSGPILIHVKTTKGKGYSCAENFPAKFHGTEAFNIKTGLPINKSKQSYSQVFGKAILDLASKNKKIIAITAAMTDGTGLNYLFNKYPDRVIDVGIAESHAVTFAAGIAKNNFIPVIAIYSSFLQRAYDQILHDVCMQNLHVIFAIDRAGIVGADGETHHGLFDISYLTHMPNMILMAPKNKLELINMLEFAIEKYNSGPIAIRYPRGAAQEILLEYNQEILIGHPEIISRGENLVLIFLGSMGQEILQVYDKLKANNLNPGLINARFAKPVSQDFINILREYNYIFIAEENIKSGGFAQSVINKFLELEIYKNNIFSFALPDEFVEQGTRDELLSLYKLDVQNIYEFVLKIILK